MNREVLEDWFESHDIEYEEYDAGFCLHINSLSSETLFHIANNNAAVEDHDMYGQFWVVDE